MSYNKRIKAGVALAIIASLFPFFVSSYNLYHLVRLYINSNFEVAGQTVLTLYIAFTSLLAVGISALVFIYQDVKYGSRRSHIPLIFFLFWTGGNDSFILYLYNKSASFNVFPIAYIPACIGSFSLILLYPLLTSKKS